MTSFYDYCMSHEKTELLTQWHPDWNAPVSPRDVSFGSHKKVWWRCEKGHVWQAQVGSRKAGIGCPFCTKRLVVPGETDLATTHPELAAQWLGTRNLPLTPQEVLAGSKRKVWWRCEKGHVWQASINNRTSYKTGCPECGRIARRKRPGVDSEVFSSNEYVKDYVRQNYDRYSLRVPKGKAKALWACAAHNNIRSDKGLVSVNRLVMNALEETYGLSNLLREEQE